MLSRISRSMLALALCLLAPCFNLKAADAGAPVDMSKRAEELKNLKWGMFICWSFSTFSEKEWTPGIKDISFFRAKDVDTDQWAKTAKEAGMGYILFLTKHHDGLCLWDTKTTDRKITKAPLGRDVLAELKKSCDKYGIKLALYFSEGEFKDNKDYHPGGYTPEMKKAQLKELLTQYGPIEYIWFDHAQTDGGLNHVDTTAWCHQWQPYTLIGYNHGQAAGEVSLRECGKAGPLGNLGAASYNKDNEAKFQGYLLAEFTYPILPGHKGGAMWFYSLPAHDGLCKSAESLYADYLGAVKYGNIFSADVGPDYNGKLRDIDVKTLQKVGEMIRSNAPMPEIPAAKEAAKKQNTTGALSFEKKAKASSSWSGGFEADKAFDGDDETRWGADKDARSGWLEVDLGKDVEVGCAMVKELGFHRTEEFAIECKEGESWKELSKGTTIAGEKVFKFKPVTARYFRLNIKKANEVPTIEEFQLFAPGAKVAVTPEKPRDPRVKWFDEAKFGMFITWGLYSVPGGTWKGQALKHKHNNGEWIEWALPIPHDEYAKIADTWEPKQFDADTWVKIAKEAGMKYLLVTAKFHDGFLMYPSKITAYNIYDRTPWKHDPVKELSEACARQGLKFGVYWNHAYDWQNPNALTPDAKASASRDFDKYINEVSLPQLKEMLVDHPLISFIWFDQARGTPEMTYERGKKFADLIHSIRPEIIYNSRLGGYPADYASMGDNQIPNSAVRGVWETAATINHTWGYKAQDVDFKSADMLILNLVDITAKGGNYILNVGPTGEGVIPAPEVERLLVMGSWLKINGEAVYGAGRSPFGVEPAGSSWRCTVQPADWTWGKPGKLYFHLLKWHAGRFEIPGESGKVMKAYMLADKEHKSLTVESAATGDKHTVILPEKATDEIDSVLCVEVE